ncbi:hypothetical protein [Candidatus Colwellia aromaticivorans]|uniref:hypothetical protein n=1 Tax=Candidatus Colwellia aromaticivorans TaxID=2267621 RepID=UPI000DF49C6C|nr:hypothetical protein [Candidatus Colwellia aromaticivorans]
MKTNRNEYLSQRVSTLEFVLVISGNFEFDEVIEACSNKQKYLYSNIFINGTEENKPCFGRVLDRLNQDIKDDPDEIRFPVSQCICPKTSKRDDEHWKYTIGDLIGWVSTKYDLSGYPLADWFKEELKKRAVDSKSTDNDKGKDYIKIETLPKILQLMIEVSNKPEYDRENSSYDEKSAISKLENLAKNKGVYFGNNQRTAKGLGNINAKKIIEYIQKDKN